MRGACSGQSPDGSAGFHRTGAPSSHFVRSYSPVLVLGVWHWVHTATPSTIYLPRATRVPALALLVLAVPADGFVFCAKPGAVTG